MKRYVKGLRGEAVKFPVVFFAEYMDMWSSGYVFTDVFPQKQGNFFNVMGDEEELLCYIFPDDGELQANLSRRMRRKSIQSRNPQETKWYLVNLMEACVAWDKVAGNAAIVVVRKVLGGLVEDEQIADSSNIVPDWCIP